MLTFRILGPVEVRDGDHVVDLGGPRQRRLLCALVAAAGQVVSVDRLAEQVWSDTDRPEGATQAVRSYVARLRRALGDGSEVVVTTPPGYTFESGDHAVDSHLAQQLLTEATGVLEHDPAAAVELLTKASALWRGEPYGEFADLEWLVADAQRLGELRRRVIESLFDARLAAGASSEIVGELERAIGEFPLSERLRGCLMLALARAGRASDAARAFQTFRDHLAEETGLDPSADLQQLEGEILAGDHGPAPGVRSSMTDARPTGTVTFLFTDVEGSTQKWAEDSEAMGASLRVHDDVLRAAIAAHGGYVFTTAGDAFCVAFSRVSDAIDTALDAQAALATADWAGPTLAVRMGIHLGQAEERGGDYFGPTVNTAARVEAAAHGGQVIITEAVRLASDTQPAVDLGEHRLRDVPDSIRLHQLNPGTFPPPRVVPESRSNLPIPPTPLIGREDTVRTVRAMLLEHRLVTLNGVGGCGKTRLAVEVAERELPTLEHGAYFADLSLISDDEGVVLAVAEAVQFQSGPGDPLEQLLDHLADKRALIILDNCEHLIEACADLAEAVLAHPGDWRMIATSREFLDVPGEHVLQVPSLRAEGDASALELFRARAKDHDAAFEIDDTNREAVRELCDRLDGMPLAIELAAARVVVMSPTELLDRIDERFRVLSGGRRRSRERRRTLEATLDWSFDLLDDDEQSALTSLGVFRGPFDVAAAAAVMLRDSLETLELLESLIAKSLVIKVTEDAETTMYRLLETVRAYAEERLQRDGSLASLRDRHLDYFATAIDATALDALATSGSRWTWRRAPFRSWVRLRPNLDAAMDWAIATDRTETAGEMLIDGVPVWREDLISQSALHRVRRVAPATTDGDLKERLLFPEMNILMSDGDYAALWPLIEKAKAASNTGIRLTGHVFEQELTVLVNPAKTLAFAETLQSDSWLRARLRGDALAYAGDFEEALQTHAPYQGMDDRLGYLVDGVIAALLFLTDRPDEALGVAMGHPDAGIAWRPFSVVIGLAHLALGDRTAATDHILTDAREAALGGAAGLSGNALIGLAALVHDRGDREWAAELILRGIAPQTKAGMLLGRYVANHIGVGDEYAAAQDAHFETGAVNETPYLKEAIARWDAEFSEEA